MTDWSNAEIGKIGAAEELLISSVRPDGTLSKPVTIWVVLPADDLYVRSVNGPTAAWFRGVQERHQGHIRAGGIDRDVTFMDAAPELNDELDAVYRAKYRRYAESIVGSIVTAQARSTTLRVVPRT